MKISKTVWYRVFIKYCVFFDDFKIFWTLAFLCFPSVSVCAQTKQITSAAAELAEFRNITKFQGKNIICYEHPVYEYGCKKFHRLLFMSDFIFKDSFGILNIKGKSYH